MSTIVTRAGKGASLTWTEADDNFTNLNTDKYELGDSVEVALVELQGNPGVTPTTGIYAPSAISMAWHLGNGEFLRGLQTVSYSYALGLGVEPSAWSNTLLPAYAIQFGDKGAIYQFSGNTHIGYNVKVNSSYQEVALTASGTPAKLEVGAGDITMKVASANPGAGVAITFTTIATAKGTDNWFQVDCGKIKFPAAQSSSSDANVLDDYEEGTWTPGVAFGGGTTGMTFTTRTGRYQKVGRNVTVSGEIQFSAKGSSAGTATLTSLPFTVANNEASRMGTALAYFGGMSLTALNYGMSLLSDKNATTAIFFQFGNASAALMSEANFSNTSNLYFTFTYEASA